MNVASLLLLLPIVQAQAVTCSKWLCYLLTNRLVLAVCPVMCALSIPSLFSPRFR